jgi:hypothetical protein
MLPDCSTDPPSTPSTPPWGRTASHSFPPSPDINLDGGEWRETARVPFSHYSCSRNNLVGRRACWYPLLQTETRHRDFRRRWALRSMK